MLITGCSVVTDITEYSVNSLLDRQQRRFIFAWDWKALNAGSAQVLHCLCVLHNHFSAEFNSKNKTVRNNYSSLSHHHANNGSLNQE